MSYSIENLVEMQKKRFRFGTYDNISSNKNIAKRRKTFSLYITEHFYLDEHGLLYHVWSPRGRSRTATKSQLVIPSNLRFDILKAFHYNPMGGHLGHEKTYDKIRVQYYWSGIYKDIQHWVRSCVDCQMRQTPRNRKERLYYQFQSKELLIELPLIA